MELQVDIIEDKNGWVIGTVGQYYFEAKTSNEPSTEGYRKGRVYKFYFSEVIKNDIELNDRPQWATGQFIASYDRGKWAEGRISNEQKPFFLAALKASDHWRISHILAEEE